MHKRNRKLNKDYLEQILPMWSERDSGSPHLKSGAQNTDPAQKILIFFLAFPYISSLLSFPSFHSKQTIPVVVTSILYGGPTPAEL